MPDDRAQVPDVTPTKIVHGGDDCSHNLHNTVNEHIGPRTNCAIRNTNAWRFRT